MSLTCSAGYAWSQGRPPAPRETPLLTEAGKVFAYHAAEDGHGGFYLAWTHQEGAQLSVVAQHMDPKGYLTWPAAGVPVASEVDSSQTWTVTDDRAGGLVVFWSRKEHMFAQRLSKDGKRLWPESRSTVTISSAPQTNPACAPDGNGGAYLIWQEKRYTGRWVLIGQHLSPVGGSLWRADGQRISLRPSDQRRPAAAADGEGGVVVAWKDFRESASQLQTQRVDSRGGLLWGEQGAIITAPVSDTAPLIISPGGGSALESWVAASAGSNRVWVQWQDPSGVLLWGGNGRQASVQPGEEWNPVLTPDGAGGAWVGWEDYRNQSKWQVYIQYYGSTSGPLGTGGIALAPVYGDQGRLRLCPDGHQGVFAAWLDNRSGSMGLYAQEVNQQGTLLLGAQGSTITESLTIPLMPQLVSVGPQTAIVIWADRKKSGPWGLYWRRIGVRGQLTTPSEKS